MPFGIPSQKGGVHIESTLFCFQGESIFCWLELVELFRLYLGASLRSLNKVHRSSTIGHALIHPIFIHRILLFLGLADFPVGEPVHVVAPLGATFLKQRAAHLRVDPSGPRGASSGNVPPPPSSTGANAAETSGIVAADADVPPSATSDDSDIRRTLDHVLTVRVAQ